MARDTTPRRYPPVNHTAYRIMLGIIEALVRLLVRYRVVGEENLPADGPVIFVSNHLHYFDTPVLGVSIPGHAYTLAAEKYEHHPLFGPILKTAGAIFINRGEVDRRALRQALNVLEDGHNLAIAVEGTRSSSGALAEGKTGAAYIATRAGVPLLPLVVWGTEEVTAGWKRLRRPVVTVRYGEPFRLPAGRVRAEQLDACTDEIMATLAALLPERYRGHYRDHPLVVEKLDAQTG